MAANDIYEPETESDTTDPDEAPAEHREVITQPYDLVVESLIDQIKKETIILRPSFQRGYVWPKQSDKQIVVRFGFKLGIFNQFRKLRAI